MSKMTKAINEIKTKLDSISGLDGKAADVVEGVLLPAVTEICNSLDLSNAKKKLFCEVKQGEIFVAYNDITKTVDVYMATETLFDVWDCHVYAISITGYYPGTSTYFKNNNKVLVFDNLLEACSYVKAYSGNDEWLNP